MDRLLQRLARSAARRGLGGEHWAWLLLAVSAYALRRARRRPDPLVTSTRLGVGESVVISLDRPPSR